MAWTQFHSIPFVDSSSYDDYHTYFLNTALPAKGWTVTAHPSGDTNKRSLSYTLTDWNTNSSSTTRFWINYPSSGSSSFTLYPDKTFTTTPGDLGTYTTGSRTVYAYTNNNLALDQFSFWESSNKPNALLVTRGRKVLFYWPGMSSYAGYNITSEQHKTYLYPFVADFGFRVGGSPIYTGTTSSLGYVFPMVHGNTSNYFTSDTNKLVRNFAFIGTSQSYPYQDSYVIYVEDNPDVGCYVSNSTTTPEWFATVGWTAYGSLIFDGTNYHLSTHSDINKMAIWFNLGTTEPVL